MITPSPEARKIQIEQITSNDRQVFEGWVNQNGPLVLPKIVPFLRFLIPPKLWDFVSNPTQVDLINLNEEGDRRTELLVVEHMPKPLSNLGSLRRYDEEYWEARKQGKVGDKLPKKPSDVDPQHREFVDEVLDGKVLVSDKVYNHIYLLPFDKELKVTAFGVRDDLRNKGIGTSFYERLKEFASGLRFNYITGFNSEDNIKFFRDKLGRLTSDELPKDLQGYFSSHHGELNSQGGDYFTVDVLDPIEKAAILKK